MAWLFVLLFVAGPACEAARDACAVRVADLCVAMRADCDTLYVSCELKTLDNWRRCLTGPGGRLALICEAGGLVLPRRCAWKRILELDCDWHDVDHDNDIDLADFWRWSWSLDWWPVR